MGGISRYPAKKLRRHPGLSTNDGHQSFHLIKGPLAIWVTAATNPWHDLFNMAMPQEQTLVFVLLLPQVVLPQLLLFPLMLKLRLLSSTAAAVSRPWSRSPPPFS